MNVRIPNDFSVSTDPIVRSMFNADLYDWWGRMLNLEEVHKYATGEGVQIVVADTGTYHHPDLEDNGQVIDCTGNNDPTDRNGHSTHCRGIMGMQANGQGYVGIVPGATINLAKILDDGGIGTESWVDQSMVWTMDNDFDVYSGSLAFDGESPKIAKRVKQMYEKGIVCCFAAGNYFKHSLAFPASLAQAIAAGAHDAGKLPANFSHTAESILQAKNLILAPGVHVHSSWIDGQYRSASGSSQSVPMVAGCAALIIELERNLGA